jgi:hypothetical protein
MSSLPDDALVVRGGTNTPESFARGTGVALDDQGRLQGVSVNAGSGVSLSELTAPDPRTGYPGIPHTQVGVTTAGAIRAAGGDVTPTPTRRNRRHATMTGLTPDQAASLFQPTVLNLNRARGRKGGPP